MTNVLLHLLCESKFVLCLLVFPNVRRWEDLARPGRAEFNVLLLSSHYTFLCLILPLHELRLDLPLPLLVNLLVLSYSSLRFVVHLSGAHTPTLGIKNVKVGLLRPWLSARISGFFRLPLLPFHDLHVATLDANIKMVLQPYRILLVHIMTHLDNTIKSAFILRLV